MLRKVSFFDVWRVFTHICKTDDIIFTSNTPKITRLDQRFGKCLLPAWKLWQMFTDGPHLCHLLYLCPFHNLLLVYWSCKCRWINTSSFLCHNSESRLIRQRLSEKFQMLLTVSGVSGGRVCSVWMNKTHTGGSVCATLLDSTERPALAHSVTAVSFISFLISWLSATYGLVSL